VARLDSLRIQHDDVREDQLFQIGSSTKRQQQVKDQVHHLARTLTRVRLASHAAPIKTHSTQKWRHQAWQPYNAQVLSFYSLLAAAMHMPISMLQYLHASSK
jgi:hypothetical protein